MSHKYRITCSILPGYTNEVTDEPTQEKPTLYTHLEFVADSDEAAEKLFKITAAEPMNMSLRFWLHRIIKPGVRKLKIPEKKLLVASERP